MLHGKNEDSGRSDGEGTVWGVEGSHGEDFLPKMTSEPHPKDSGFKGLSFPLSSANGPWAHVGKMEPREVSRILSDDLVAWSGEREQ